MGFRKLEFTGLKNYKKRRKTLSSYIPTGFSSQIEISLFSFAVVSVEENKIILMEKIFLRNPIGVVIFFISSNSLCISSYSVSS